MEESSANWLRFFIGRWQAPTKPFTWSGPLLEPVILHVRARRVTTIFYDLPSV